MQTIRSISISNGNPAMAFPLTVIVIISMIKDAYEDLKRHKADKAENERQVQVYDPKTQQLESREWKNVRVG